jgi:hypothetical protein
MIVSLQRCGVYYQSVDEVLFDHDKRIGGKVMTSIQFDAWVNLAGVNATGQLRTFESLRGCTLSYKTEVFDHFLFVCLFFYFYFFFLFFFFFFFVFCCVFFFFVFFFCVFWLKMCLISVKHYLLYIYLLSCRFLYLWVLVHESQCLIKE